jgi:hypothetical protein
MLPNTTTTASQAGRLSRRTRSPSPLASPAAALAAKRGPSPARVAAAGDASGGGRSNQNNASGSGGGTSAATAADAPAAATPVPGPPQAEAEAPAAALAAPEAEAAVALAPPAVAPGAAASGVAAAAPAAAAPRDNTNAPTAAAAAAAGPSNSAGTTARTNTDATAAATGAAAATAAAAENDGQAADGGLAQQQQQQQASGDEEEEVDADADDGEFNDGNALSADNATEAFDDDDDDAATPTASDAEADAHAVAQAAMLGEITPAVALAAARMVYARMKVQVVDRGIDSRFTAMDGINTRSDEIDAEIKAELQRSRDRVVGLLRDRVHMMLSGASVLIEAILTATDARICKGTKRSPVVWLEIQSLARAKSIDSAMATAGMTVAGSISWRASCALRPTTFAELCENEFCLTDFMIVSRRGIILRLAVVKGVLTLVDDRIELRDGFDYARAPDMAKGFGTTRRERARIRRIMARQVRLQAAAAAAAAAQLAQAHAQAAASQAAEAEAAAAAEAGEAAAEVNAAAEPSVVIDEVIEEAQEQAQEEVVPTAAAPAAAPAPSAAAPSAAAAPAPAAPAPQPDATATLAADLGAALLERLTGEQEEAQEEEPVMVDAEDDEELEEEEDDDEEEEATAPAAAAAAAAGPSSGPAAAAARRRSKRVASAGRNAAGGSTAAAAAAAAAAQRRQRVLSAQPDVSAGTAPAPEADANADAETEAAADGDAPAATAATTPTANATASPVARAAARAAAAFPRFLGFGPRPIRAVSVSSGAPAVRLMQQRAEERDERLATQPHRPLQLAVPVLHPPAPPPPSAFEDQVARLSEAYFAGGFAAAVRPLAEKVCARAAQGYGATNFGFAAFPEEGDDGQQQRQQQQQPQAAANNNNNAAQQQPTAQRVVRLDFEDHGNVAERYYVAVASIQAALLMEEVDGFGPASRVNRRALAFDERAVPSSFKMGGSFTHVRGARHQGPGGSGSNAAATPAAVLLPPEDVPILGTAVCVVWVDPSRLGGNNAAAAAAGAGASPGAPAPATPSPQARNPTLHRPAPLAGGSPSVPSPSAASPSGLTLVTHAGHRYPLEHGTVLVTWEQALSYRVLRGRHHRRAAMAAGPSNQPPPPDALVELRFSASELVAQANRDDQVVPGV